MNEEIEYEEGEEIEVELNDDFSLIKREGHIYLKYFSPKEEDYVEILTMGLINQDLLNQDIVIEGKVISVTDFNYGYSTIKSK